MPLVAFLQTLHFAVGDTGALELLSPWLPCLIFSREFLDGADGRRVVLRGDEVEIRCANGRAVYALGPAVDDGTRAGSLLRAWGP